MLSVLSGLPEEINKNHTTCAGGECRRFSKNRKYTNTADRDFSCVPFKVHTQTRLRGGCVGRVCVRCVVSMSMCDNRKRRSVTQKHSKRIPCGCACACAACAFFFFTDTAGKKQGETGRRRGQKREGTSEGREVVRKLCKNRKGRERGESGGRGVVCYRVRGNFLGGLWLFVGSPAARCVVG